MLILGVAYRGGVKETAFSGAFPLRDALLAAARSVVAADPLYDDDELRALGFEPWDGEPVDGRVVQADHAEYETLEIPGRRDRRRRAAIVRARPGGVAASSASSASSATTRSPRAPVAVELRALGRRRALPAPPAPRRASRSTSTFQPASTVSTHSVVSRSVTHGTPAR